MKDKKDIKLSKEHMIKLNDLTDELLKTKKIRNLQEFNEIMKKINKEAKIIQLSLIQKFILLFYSYYNNLVSESQNEKEAKLIKLANLMITNFKKENILNSIQTEINMNFSNDFKNYKIFSDKIKEKDTYEICFSICIISKNIKLMEAFFTEYLEVSEFNKDNFISINLENPYASKLFDSLFNKLYEKIKKSQREGFSSIIEECKKGLNSSLFNMVRCSKCYDIMMINLNKEDNFQMKCSHCEKKYKEYTEEKVRETIFLKFYCVVCNSELFLYEENYKCTRCKSLLCPQCKSEHFRKCFSLNCIKLYEVGYKCESHNCKYIYYCFDCHKNLCKICKEIHHHKVKEINNIDNLLKKYIQIYNSTEGLNKSKNGGITNDLSFIYLDRKKNKLFNGHIHEILCELLRIDLNDRKNNNLFQKFNDKDFQMYYSILLNKISLGNLYSLNCLNSIKLYYKKKNAFEYDYFTISERENKIQKFIDKCNFIWAKFDDIHRFTNYDSKLNDLRLSDNKLQIKIDNLRAKLLIYENSYKIQQENTHNILSRFFADELLRSIIVLYHDKLDKIGLNLNIFLDLISHSNYDIISNKYFLDKISEISTDFSKFLNEFKKNPNKEGLKDEIYNFIPTSYKIKFIDDIKINDEIFKKEDLNKILEILFFIKSTGNITVHPNIDKNESLKMNNIKNLPLKFEIDSFYDSELKSEIEKIKNNYEKTKTKEDDNLPKLLEEEGEEEDIYYHLNNINNELGCDYNLFKNLEDYMKGLKGNIEIKIKEIRDNILSSLNIGKIKTKISIEDIIESLFNGQDKIIFEESTDFIKTLVNDTDNVIKKYLSLDIEKKLIDENKNINHLINTLEMIPLLLKGFIKLNIPKHNNLKEYIKDIINNTKIDYDNYILFIEKLENKFLDEENIEIDCRKNEIIAEACFLLMIKTYENEIQFLKSIKKNYENEIIKNLIYEDIEHKLDEINHIFEENYGKTSIKLINLIQTKFFPKDNTNDLTLDHVKYILTKIINNINVDESKNTKLNIDSQLYYLQHLDSL